MCINFGRGVEEDRENGGGWSGERDKGLLVCHVVTDVRARAPALPDTVLWGKREVDASLGYDTQGPVTRLSVPPPFSVFAHGHPR